ncbi:MAG: cytochrome c [Granulosicoccus sp.]
MKMLRAVYLTLLPTIVLLATTANAGASDRELGQQLARQCSACHGKNGIAVDPESSNLAGQSALYLEKSLKDYKTGARQDRRMSLIAQGLSDDDIKALAAWYSSFTIEVTPPQ